MSARRRTHATTVMVAASTIMALAACTGPSEGTITETASTPISSETPDPKLMFALEIPEDICPTAEIIPEDLAAPESIGYEDRSGPSESAAYLNQECSYFLDAEASSVDGTQVVQDLIVQFAVTDGSPLAPFLENSFSEVDFEEVEAAVYFHNWDQANEKYTPRYDPLGKEFEDSYRIIFDFYASLSNLYIYAQISFVVTDEDNDMKPDLDAEAAAYQILEAIVAPVVADLERQ